MDLSTLITNRVAPDAEGEATRRIATTLYRLLARGRPVAPGRLAAHAGASPADVEAVLGDWGGTRRDDDGRVVAFGGLDLAPTPHALTVDGTRLHTWCAWDTFFIPLVLGAAGTVESRSPDGDLVTLTVSPDGVRDLDPATAVLSLVRPPAAGTEELRAVFCDQVLLFPDEAAGSRWAAGREGVSLVPVEEGARLGHRHALSLLGDEAPPQPAPLVQLDLRHDPGAGLELPATAEGEPVGSGTGRASGAVLDGALRWALAERVGDGVCAMDVFAVIDTSDGATVELEGQGFARLADPATSRWEVAGALRMTSDDPRYAWLGDQLAAWEGESDLSTGTGSWRARLPG